MADAALETLPLSQAAMPPPVLKVRSLEATYYTDAGRAKALDDVSFDLAAGESLGIIGENGAGKSTLLKVIAGVITPTRGRADVRGRVGALLELGSGFHPDYSGLDNIDLAAALLGLRPAEIAAKRDGIVAFADIGEHLKDETLKRYFLAESLKRANFRAELENELHRAGMADVKESGTTAGALHRGGDRSAIGHRAATAGPGRRIARLPAAFGAACRRIGDHAAVALRNRSDRKCRDGRPHRHRMGQRRSR